MIVVSCFVGFDLVGWLGLVCCSRCMVVLRCLRLV